jgi:hypothetical protein
MPKSKHRRHGKTRPRAFETHAPERKPDPSPPWVPRVGAGLLVLGLLVILLGYLPVVSDFTSGAALARFELGLGAGLRPAGGGVRHPGALALTSRRTTPRPSEASTTCGQPSGRKARCPRTCPQCGPPSVSRPPAGDRRHPRACDGGRRVERSAAARGPWRSALGRDPRTAAVPATVSSGSPSARACAARSGSAPGAVPRTSSSTSVPHSSHQNSVRSSGPTGAAGSPDAPP